MNKNATQTLFSKKQTPPPEKEDQGIQQAREKQRLQELSKVNKRRNIFAGEISSPINLTRPGATLLGG